jgi:hypothetical protein
VVSRGEVEVDEERLDAGKAMGSSVCSVASSYDDGRRME